MQKFGPRNFAPFFNYTLNWINKLKIKEKSKKNYYNNPINELKYLNINYFENCKIERRKIGSKKSLCKKVGAKFFAPKSIGKITL